MKELNCSTLSTNEYELYNDWNFMVKTLKRPETIRAEVQYLESVIKYFERDNERLSQSSDGKDYSRQAKNRKIVKENERVITACYSLIEKISGKRSKGLKVEGGDREWTKG